MRLNSVKILKIYLTVNSKEKILEYCQKYLEKGAEFRVQSSKLNAKPLVIVTPNPEQIVYVQRDPHFTQLLNQADIALPDGIGVVAAARLLQPTVPLRRIPGVEFMEDLVKLAAERGDSIALIGGRGELAAEALECLQRKYPELVGWTQELPEMSIKGSVLSIKGKSLNTKYLIPDTLAEDIFERIAKRIIESNTRLVFVGLGAPKQEYLIERLAYHLSLITYHPAILMSVGGAFAILAGQLPRAPFFVRTIGFEWLWRLLREPWRGRRQLALLKFIFLVLREKTLSVRSTTS